MTLNEKIQIYLSLNSIAYTPEDYLTGQPSEQEDQIIEWNSDKLGEMPTQAQLDNALSIKEKNDNADAYKAKRAAEYPQVADYLDGIVKGDKNQVQAYIDACLAVKAKYPKP